MLTKLISKNRSGFTLVELLIVVAIVGILATVGIPGYQRMVQKSRQSEAKVNLGNVALVESTFFSEYGAYGNNLNAMGYESDNEQNMRYVIGFVTAGCAQLGIIPTGPAVDQYAVAINAGNAQYFSAATTPNPVVGGPALPSFRSRFGYYVTPTANLPGSGRVANCQLSVSPAAPTYNTYTATASGLVAPGFLLDGSGANNPLDGWQITQTKALANVTNGIR